MKGTPEKPSCGFSEHICDTLKKVRYVIIYMFSEKIKYLAVNLCPDNSNFSPTICKIGQNM